MKKDRERSEEEIREREREREEKGERAVTTTILGALEGVCVTVGEGRVRVRPH